MRKGTIVPIIVYHINVQLSRGDCKMLKAILFDLDGTLLPMDQELFTKAYFRCLSEYLVPFGYKPKELIDEVCQGIYAMVKNRGEKTNESVFWERFTKKYVNAVQDKPLFDQFYLTKFDELKSVCGFDKRAGELIKLLKSKGVTLVLATNPVFPMTAQKKRLLWAGINPDDFTWITSYENSHSCKPNPQYYKEIAEMIGVKSGDCLMVGNDTTEDAAAMLAGADFFLLTDCLLNKESKDISKFTRGSFAQLVYYIENLK